MKPLTVPDVSDVYFAAGAGDFLQEDVLPLRISDVFDLNDRVAFAKASLLGRGARGDVPDCGRLVSIGELRIPNHEQSRQEADSQENVHPRTGKRDDQPLPSRLSLK